MRILLKRVSCSNCASPLACWSEFWLSLQGGTVVREPTQLRSPPQFAQHRSVSQSSACAFVAKPFLDSRVFETIPVSAAWLPPPFQNFGHSAFRLSCVVSLGLVFAVCPDVDQRLAHSPRAAVFFCLFLFFFRCLRPGDRTKEPRNRQRRRRSPSCRSFSMLCPGELEDRLGTSSQ